MPTEVLSAAVQIWYETASPTAMTVSHLITAIIDAKQEKDVITADIPNAFDQTYIENKLMENKHV